MGTSIEYAIVFSLVLVMLGYLFYIPNQIVRDSEDISEYLFDEIEFHMENSRPVSDRRIASVDSQDTCPEILFTMFSGLSECYWIMTEELL